MNDVNETEETNYEKNKKATEDDESYEEEENEEMENSPEGSLLEEVPFSETRLPFGPAPTQSSIDVSQNEPSIEGSVRDSTLLKRTEAIIRKKWMGITGIKPQNIPTVKKFSLETEDTEKVEFFGDRRPAKIEKQRREKWVEMLSKHPTGKPMLNLGKIKREIRLPYLSDGLTCVKFAPYADILSTGCRNGGVQIRKVSTGEVLLHLKTLELLDRLAINSITYHPLEKKKIFVGGGTGIIQVFDVDSASFIATSERGPAINVMDMNNDGSIVVAAGKNGNISIFDVNALKIVSVKNRPPLNESSTSNINDDYHRLRVYGLKFHPAKNELFVTGGWDRTLKIWDVRIPTAVRSIWGPFISGNGIDVLDDKILSASWSAEKSLQLWNFATGKLIQNIPIKTRATIYEGEFLYTAHFYKEGVRDTPANSNLAIVGGSGFNEVDLINIRERKVVATFPAYKAVVALDSMDSCVAYGGKESLFRIGETSRMVRKSSMKV